MSTVVDTLKRAARQCSVSQPSSWVLATDDTSLEVKDFLDETVGDILDRIDPPSPIGVQTTLTTTGAETYSLPSDFRRLQRDASAVFETTNQRRPLIPVSNDGEWTHLKEIGSTGAERYFRVDGYDGNHTISIFENPSASTGIVVSYVTNNWLATSAGVVGSTLANEDDVLLLPRRLVEAGIVWRFRERKGLPAADRHADYEAQLARLSNDSRTRRKIGFGVTAARAPWDVPVPDFIPAS